MAEGNTIPASPAEDENWYAEDPALAELLATHVPEETLEAVEPRLDALGELAPGRLDAWARTADARPPELARRSPTGERVDELVFHPAYRELQRAAREHRTFTLSWHELEDGTRPPRVATLALGYLYAKAEAGYYCPACMTDGAAFVLDRHADEALKERYLDRLIATDPDEGIEGAMYLTEKEGGSDVGGATRTRATRADDGTWRLTGEKWFASNCGAEVALALARTPDADPDAGTEGLGLFLLPREMPDGTRNPGLTIARLKDKLGVRSMPTGEIVLDEAHAYLVEDAPGGFKAMAEMVNLSRLYNAVASVAVARRALREGLRAGVERSSFGSPLREHALFQRDLVELTVDVEGALAFVLDAASVFDAWADGEASKRGVVRVLTPCAKAATGKLAVRAASEGCELLGGAGYIEEYVTPRLLRDAQVLPIWEGTTNIQSLDLVRAIAREGALANFLSHAKARREPAADHAPVEGALAAAREHLAAVRSTVQGWPDADRASVEAQARDVLYEAYHAHATGLLARRAALHDDARAARVATLYAARHLESEGEGEGRHAVRAALDEHGLEIAYPHRA